MTAESANDQTEASDDVVDESLWVETGIDGVMVGHWTHIVARTGCTVVRLPPDTVASGEVRGGAPATREFALLEPTATVGTVDAVVLTGGSAFGLAAADGVMAELEAEGRGFATPAGPVPIVVAMALYDLGVGDATVRPGPVEGGKALSTAKSRFQCGVLGAGSGATVNKWAGESEPGGLGGAAIEGPNGVRVVAVVAVNAVGALAEGSRIADVGPPAAMRMGESTTIGVIITNATLNKAGCHRLAQGGHDGLARALLPAHTSFDGDAIVAAATGEIDYDLTHLSVLAQQAVEAAVSACRPPSRPAKSG